MAETDTQGASNKLDAPSDIAELVKPAEGAYQESESHRPAPLYQYGTLDTSDTGGTVNNSMAEVSPVFAEARAQNLVTAARALDPDDDGVGSELVILPESTVTVSGSARTPEDAKAELQGAINKLRENPVQVGGQTPGQQEAAEEQDDPARSEKDETDRADDSRKPSQSTGGHADPETHPTPDSPSRRGARSTRG